MEACAAKNPLLNLADYVERVKVVSNLNDELLCENANRVSRILKETSDKPIEEKYFVEQIEKTLYNEIMNVDSDVDYNQYLKELQSLNTTVAEFFDKVLVMDKDENVKNNRISLLTLLKQKYEHLTDFAKL